MSDQQSADRDAPGIPGVDTSVPQSPRVWDYWLGGKDNYAIDRLVGEEVKAATPQIVEVARTSRAFLGRAVEYLAGTAGIRQFLDIGTGLPTADNTHEIAQRVAPESRIVYVDNDPIVLAHARALLHGTAAGRTAYLDADVQDPDSILRMASDTLDLDQPVALVLMNILGHIEDWDRAKAVAAQLVGALPSGSYLVASDASNVIDPDGMNSAARIYNEHANPRYHLRAPDQQAELFEGLELVEPGLVSCPLWHPRESDIGEPTPIDQFGGVARKP